MPETLFCRASRLSNLRLSGRDEPICVTAARGDGWLMLVLDLVLWAYDGPDHCLRMRAMYGDPWGVNDGLDRAGLGL